MVLRLQPGISEKSQGVLDQILGAVNIQALGVWSRNTARLREKMPMPQVQMP